MRKKRRIMGDIADREGVMSWYFYPSPLLRNTLYRIWEIHSIESEKKGYILPPPALLLLEMCSTAHIVFLEPANDYIQDVNSSCTSMHLLRHQGTC